MIIILASYKFHFIRVHDNLVYDPCNKKSISVDNKAYLNVIHDIVWVGEKTVKGID